MTNQNENVNVQVIRRAYEAYARGDVTAVLGIVDPDLEWTFLDRKSVV